MKSLSSIPRNVRFFSGLLVLLLTWISSENCSAQCTATVTTVSGDLTSDLFPTGDEFLISIHVFDDLHVDDDLVLIRCELIMEPGAEIIVHSGVTLDLSGCLVHACTDMWRGITAQDGSNIHLTPDATYHTDIYDAENAITLNNDCSIFMNEAYFGNNRVAVHVPSRFPFWNNVTWFMRDCTFEAPGPLAAPYPGQTTILGDKGYAAFDVNDVSLHVGNIGLNLIRQSSNGIVAARSDVIVRQTVIVNIIEDPAYVHYANGSAIWANGAGGGEGLYTLDQQGLGVGVTSISQCNQGIWAEYMNVVSSDNFMWNVGTGYRVERARYCDVAIQENEIETNGTSIDLRFNEGCNSLLVANNTITFGSNSPVKGYKGIYVVEGGKKNWNSVIRDNHITFRAGSTNARWGIWLSSASNYTVSGNTLVMTNNAVNKVGVYTAGCKYPFVSCNDIEGSFGSYGVDMAQSAIRNNLGVAPAIMCNTMTGTTNGLYFTGPAYGTDLSGNHMHEHKWGLHLDPTTIIEAQVLKGNMWYEPAAAGGSQAWYENTVHAFNYRFYYDPTFGPGSPVPGTLDPSYWFVPQVGQNFLCANAGLGCDAINIAGCTGCPTELDHLIATDSLLNDPYTPETRYMLKGELYEKLDNDPSLLMGDQDLADFYAAMQNTTIQQFKEIDDDQLDLYALDATIEGYIQQNKAQVEALMVQMEVTLEQLADSTLTMAQRQAILVTASGLQQSIGALTQLNAQALQQARTTRDLQADNVKASYAAVYTSELIEANEKQVNEVYLSSIAKDVPGFTASQQNELFAIANQCPMLGGNAVYLARSMYSLIDDEFDFDDAGLCLQHGLIYRNAEREEEQQKVTVVPNPVNTSATLHYRIPAGTMAALVIYDVVGKEVRQYRLSDEAVRFQFDTSQLPQGTYHYALRTGSALQGSGVIVVVH